MKKQLTPEEKAKKKEARKRAIYFLKSSTDPRFANHPENLKRDTHALLLEKDDKGRTKASRLFRGCAVKVTVNGSIIKT